MVFVVKLKWVVERLQQGVCPAFTQFMSRLAAPSPSLIAQAISAMSILYQQWRMCACLGYFVSAHRAKTYPSHLISNLSESMLILVYLYLLNSLSGPEGHYLLCDQC